MDARALLFQVINFAALLILLRLFAYKPILAILEARRQKIEEGLRTAEQMERDRARLRQEEQRRLAQAESKAAEILRAAQRQSEGLVQAAEAKAAASAERLLQEAAAKMEREVVEIRHELKREVVELVALATERIADSKLDPKKDAALIEQALAAVSKGERRL